MTACPLTYASIAAKVCGRGTLLDEELAAGEGRQGRGADAFFSSSQLTFGWKARPLSGTKSTTLSHSFFESPVLPTGLQTTMADTEATLPLPQPQQQPEEEDAAVRK